MNTDHLNNPLVLALGKVTILLLLSLIVSLLLRKPAARSLFLTCAIIASPIVFSLSFTNPLLSIIPSNGQTQTLNILKNRTIKPDYAPITDSENLEQKITIILTEPQTSTGVSSITDIAPAKKLVTKSPDLKPGRYTPVLYTVIAVAIIMMLVILLSSWKLLLFKKHTAHGRPLEIWNSICQPTHKKYDLYFAETTSDTFAHGIIRPRVIIPVDSTNWPDQKLYATLTHEAAHLRRLDPLTRMVSSIVRACLWFHPFIWIAHRQLIQAQEESCDQAALATGITAENYAEELLAAASHYTTKTPKDALAMARRSQIGKRIYRIINQKIDNLITIKTVLSIIIDYLVRSNVSTMI